MKVKKILAVSMAFVMFVAGFSLSSVAKGEQIIPTKVYSEAEWDAYWSQTHGDNTLISLTPGADETKMNFCWHSGLNEIGAKVRISKSESMADYREFRATLGISDQTDQRVNKVTATGLEPNTTYYYTYGSSKGFSKPEVFRTPGTDEFSALFISDIQPSGNSDDPYSALGAQSYAWQKTLHTALSGHNDISFIISGGDQTNYGNNPDEWAAFLAPQALRSLPIATTIGNHDAKGTNYRSYVNNPNTYYGTTPSKTGKCYWFRYGDALFMVLNSTSYNIFDTYNFVLDAIEKNPDARWRVGLMHHDIYGPGHHAEDGENAWLRAEFVPIFDAFDFDLVLTGHDHIYGRSHFMKGNKAQSVEGYSAGAVTDPEGTLFLTANSAAGKCRLYDEPYDFPWLAMSIMTEDPFYSKLTFDSDTLSIKTYSGLDNSEVDSFSITKTDFTFDENAETGVPSYLNDAVKVLTGDYYVIIEIISKIIKFALTVSRVI